MEKAYKHWGMMVGSSPASDGRVVIALDFGAMDPEKLCLDKGGLFMLFYIYYDLHSFWCSRVLALLCVHFAGLYSTLLIC